VTIIYYQTAHTNAQNDFIFGQSKFTNLYAISVAPRLDDFGALEIQGISEGIFDGGLATAIEKMFLFPTLYFSSERSSACVLHD
jgi:hypothetical protein